MKKTLIGIVIGLILVLTGVYFLADGFTFKVLEINEVISPNDSASYISYSRSHSNQIMNITGDKFNLSLSTPKNGLQIPTTLHTNPLELSWTHLDDGISNVTIQNIDDSNLKVNAILTTTTDISMLKYFLIIIIIGVGIIVYSTVKTKKN